MRLTLMFTLGVLVTTSTRAQEARQRARDIGVAPGVFKPGAKNAITDVAGVRVGQVTIKALAFEQEGRRLAESRGVDPARV